MFDDSDPFTKEVIFESIYFPKIKFAINMSSKKVMATYSALRIVMKAYDV